MTEIVKLEHVSKQIGGREILKDVSMSVNRGDIFGYLGPNGAGKTTTIRIMLGLMKATSGTALVLGQDSQNDVLRRKIGFLLEVDGLYDNMSAHDNLAYYAQLYGMDNIEDRISRAIKLVGLSDRTADKAGTFSKGMRQRLALARAILPDPEVLILDEPTSGVDPSGQIEIRQIMLDMVRKEGKTILLSSHNLDEVQRICNRIALIHKGQIKLYGELEKLQKDMSRGEVIIETAEPVPAEIIEELKSLPDIFVHSQNGKILSLNAGKNPDVSPVVTLLATHGVRIEQVKKQEASLEDIYTTILKEAGQN